MYEIKNGENGKTIVVTGNHLIYEKTLRKFVFVKDGQVPEACFEIHNKDKIKRWYQKYKNKRNGTYMPLSRCLWQQQLQPWIRF